MIFATCIPKAGTHLLAASLKNLTGIYPKSVKEKTLSCGSARFAEYSSFPNLTGHFRAGSISASPALRELFDRRSVIILIRDPRDICNSMLHYLRKSPNPDHQALYATISHLDYKHAILRVAAGIRAEGCATMVPDLEKHCGGFLEVRELYPRAIVVRYESLLANGPDVQRLGDAVAAPFELISDCVRNAVESQTITKRAGVPNAWRENFDLDLKSCMNTRFGELITRLGYEV